jgi:hypothetical protein
MVSEMQILRWLALATIAACASARQQSEPAEPPLTPASRFDPGGPEEPAGAPTIVDPAPPELELPASPESSPRQEPDTEPPSGYSPPSSEPAPEGTWLNEDGNTVTLP